VPTATTTFKFKVKKNKLNVWYFMWEITVC
jgi:hypothetical protein